MNLREVLRAFIRAFLWMVAIFIIAGLIFSVISILSGCGKEDIKPIQYNNYNLFVEAQDNGQPSVFCANETVMFTKYTNLVHQDFIEIIHIFDTVSVASMNGAQFDFKMQKDDSPRGYIHVNVVSRQLSNMQIDTNDYYKVTIYKNGVYAMAVESTGRPENFINFKYGNW